MTKKIFNEQGFLTSEGKAFVNENFTKEVKKIIATATDNGDILTISCILKTIVGDIAANHALTLRPPPPPVDKTTKNETVKPTLTIIKPEFGGKVIPFPGNRAIKEISTLLGGMSDVPLMDSLE